MADKLGLAVVSEKYETSERGLKLTLYFHIFDDGAFNVKRANKKERKKETQKFNSPLSFVHKNAL
jgi:hypothetical protein